MGLTRPSFGGFWLLRYALYQLHKKQKEKKWKTKVCSKCKKKFKAKKDYYNLCYDCWYEKYGRSLNI